MTRFFQRWSERKLQQDAQVEQKHALSEEKSSEENSPEEKSTVAENEDNAENTLAQLIASDAEKQEKQAVLRQLFHSGEFNEVDDLGDYTDDKSCLTPPSEEVLKGLRSWLDEDTIEIEHTMDSVEDKTEPCEQENIKKIT